MLTAASIDAAPVEAGAASRGSARRPRRGMSSRLRIAGGSSPARGDERWVRAAYGAHGAELFGYAVSSLGDAGLAEEAVQETFVKAWRAAARFDPELGSLRTWLFAILRNVIIDAARARDTRPQAAGAGVAIGEPPAASLEVDLDRALLSWQLEEALRRLTEEHRYVLVETVLRGRTSTEVAEQLGLPEGTVRSRVYYGLRALRLALDELGWTDAG